MTQPRSSPFLTRLPHDVRLVIYSYLILPPFDACTDCAGLLLSCRQLKEEMEMEAKRKLRMDLDDISKEQPAWTCASLRVLGINEELRIGGHLDFLLPASVLGTPVIEVKVPFLLPESHHDWHIKGSDFLELSVFATRVLPLDSSQDWQKTFVRRRQEQQTYIDRVTQLLQPLKKLYTLYASLNFHLIADESTATQLAGDIMLRQQFEVSRRRPGLLGNNVLGRLLDVYLGQLDCQAANQMQDCPHDWAFNTKTAKTTWSFTSPGQPALQQDHWYHGPTLLINHGVYNQTSCTEDRREGVVQTRFDIVECTLKAVDESKRRHRRKLMMTRLSRLRQNLPGDIDQSRCTKHSRRLGRLRQKLHKFGIEEGPEPEPDESEISIAKVLARMEAERENNLRDEAARSRCDGEERPT